MQRHRKVQTTTWYDCLVPGQIVFRIMMMMMMMEEEKETYSLLSVAMPMMMLKKCYLIIMAITITISLLRCENNRDANDDHQEM